MKLQAVQQGIQHQVLAQVLQQSLQILQMPLLDLKNLLEQELQSNPVLEEAAVIRSKPLPEFAPIENAVAGLMLGSQGGPRWETAAPEEDEEEDNPLSSVAQPPPSLTDALMRQLSGLTSTDQESEAVETIVGSLDKNGYLPDSLPEISEQSGVPVAALEKALALVQQCEPPGIGARSLAECLLIQLEALGLGESLAARLVRGGALEELARKEYAQLGKRFSASATEVREAARTISSLDPRPGQRMSGGEIGVPIVPDIVISREARGKYRVQLRDEELPALRVSPSYQRMLNDPGASEEVRSFVRERIQAAVAMLRGVQQRHQTMQRMAEAIVTMQPEFLDGGLPMLRPMTYREMAEVIGRHPSTVARATANKYVECPSGTFPLSALFSASLACGEGEVSAESVKAKVQEIVSSEDPARPLSDEAIAARLRDDGIRCARRTVAKYRGLMNIPPASGRRKR